MLRSNNVRGPMSVALSESRRGLRDERDVDS